MPVVVTDLGYVKALSAGDGHTCAILGDGTMRCWGANDRGQLGDGSFEDRLQPVEVSGAAYAKDVSCGAAHTCAVAADGLVACWGRGDSGQLGHGDFDDQNVWTTIEAIELVTNVAAGGAHSCARVGDGTVACWGANDAGQLGTPPAALVNPLPFQVSGLDLVSDIRAGGTSTCVRLGDGTLRCFGNGEPGAKPVAQVALADSFEVSNEGGCARVASGEVSCWGQPPGASDEVGGQSAATAVGGMTDFAAPIAIVAGISSTCAILSGGTVRCWGFNAANQLGNWSTAGVFAPASQLPTPVDDVEGAVRATGIGSRTCVATGDGRVRCWGGSVNVLGGGPDPTTQPYVPTHVAGFSDAFALGAGDGTKATCAVRIDGRIWCWGLASYLVEVAHHAIAVSNLKRFVAASGRVRAWDSSAGTVEFVDEVDHVTLLDSESGLTAVRGDGTVWIWQYSLPLQPSGSVSIDVPTRLGGFANVVDLDSAWTQVIAGLRSDGRVQTWGTGGTTGGYYRLGVPDPYASTWGWKKGADTLDNIFTADQIEHAIDIAVESAVSPASCCALIADGTVKCWGSLQSGKSDHSTLPAIYIPKVMPYLP